MFIICSMYIIFFLTPLSINNCHDKDDPLGVKVPDAETLLTENGKCLLFCLQFKYCLPNYTTTVLAENGMCLLFFNLLKYYLSNIIVKTI
jgi:hypothetical protein